MNHLVKKYHDACINDGTIVDNMDHRLFLDKLQDRLLDCYEELNSVFGSKKDKYAQKLIELAGIALSQVHQLDFDPELKMSSVIKLHEERGDEAIIFSNVIWNHYTSGYFKVTKTHERIEFSECLGVPIFRHTKTKNGERKKFYTTATLESDEKTEDEIIEFIKTLKK